MAKFDLDIAFKQTTSKRVKCKLCSKSVDGEDGYIKLNLDYTNYGWGGGYYEKRIVVCQECSKIWLDNIVTATAKKKESYNKLVKTKILKSLK